MTTDHPVIASVPGSIEVRLDDEAIDALAERIAAQLDRDRRARQARATPGAGEEKLLSAAQVAAWWGIDRAWVYSHAEELGAHRLGTGSKPRLRFDPDTVRMRLAPALERGDGDHPQAIRGDTRRSRRTPDDSRRLLPFRTDTELSSNDPNESRSGARNAPPTGARRTAGSTRRAAFNGTRR